LSTTYQLAVVNQFGCSDTDDVFIYVWPLVSVTAGPDSSVCYGQPITLWANNVGPIIGPFQWHSSRYDIVANTQNITVSPTHSDLYTVAVNGPCNSDSTSVQVNVYMPPPVTLEPSATIVAGQPYSILSVGNGNANWYPNYMITCTDCVNPTVSPEVNTTYHVILTDIHGCIDSAKITVTVLCDRTNAVYVPNAFTPSKPGLNDHFYIQGTGVKEVNFLRIYNRWGNLVFSSEHFQINQKDLGWDGRFGGHDLSSDVFMYQMQVECANGNIFPISGNFTLIR
jgi:gliding motility-associated-like protein